MLAEMKRRVVEEIKDVLQNRCRIEAVEKKFEGPAMLGVRARPLSGHGLEVCDTITGHIRVFVGTAS